MTWFAHVTVATVVVDNDRYLMVYENSDTGPVYNQPAGHLEEHETLPEAALRETLEETGWQVTLTGVLGVHLYKAPSNGVTYVRITFVAQPLARVENAVIDGDIIETRWLTYAEMKAQTQLRSPMVMSDIERHRAGLIQPMEFVTSIHI